MPQCYQTDHPYLQKSLHRWPLQHQQELSFASLRPPKAPPSSTHDPQPTLRLSHHPQPAGLYPSPWSNELQSHTTCTSRHLNSHPQKNPTIHSTWAPHAVDGWYLGPAMHHYCCYYHIMWIWETTTKCIADTLAWFPSKVTIPTPSSAEAPLPLPETSFKPYLCPSPT